jgi:rfaE bifunctional protein kinase chain/domain
LPRILVVGDSMLDRYWHGVVERISPEAPVPVVRVTGEHARPGGAANVAMNIAALGARCTLITAIGDDEPGECLRGMLDTAGVALVAVPAALTTVKLRVVGQSQQIARIDFERAPERHPGMLAAFAEAPKTDIVLLSDYGKGALTDCASMIRTAKAQVLVDPKVEDWEAYRGAAIVTPNRAEFAAALGKWNSEAELERKAQEALEWYSIGCIVLTRSEEGMSVFDRDGHLRIPTEARSVYDVTGAGDTVAATLAVFIAEGMSPREAATYANRAAGIAVGKFGAVSVTRADLMSEVVEYPERKGKVTARPPQERTRRVSAIESTS